MGLQRVRHDLATEQQQQKGIWEPCLPGKTSNLTWHLVFFRSHRYCNLQIQFYVKLGVKNSQVRSCFFFFFFSPWIWRQVWEGHISWSLSAVRGSIFFSVYTTWCCLLWVLLYVRVSSPLSSFTVIKIKALSHRDQHLALRQCQLPHSVPGFVFSQHFSFEIV